MRPEVSTALMMAASSDGSAEAAGAMGLGVLSLSIMRPLEQMAETIQRYRKERRGLMTTNFAECGGFLKTQPDLDVPDIQLHFVIAMLDDHGTQRDEFLHRSIDAVDGAVKRRARVDRERPS